MRYILLSYLLITGVVLFGQKNEGENGILKFWAGAKIRPATIYPQGYPDAIRLPAINAFEQPGKHLAGPGIEIAEEIAFSNSVSFTFNQGIRYDYIYQRFSLEQIPPPDFKYSIKRKVIYDLFIELEKELKNSPTSYFSFFIGAGIYGLNTGYYLTERVYLTPSNYTERTRKKNFIYPAVLGGLGWNYKRLQSLFRVGYCWNDPTILDSPFLFPEISFRYRLFSLSRKD